MKFSSVLSALLVILNGSQSSEAIINCWEEDKINKIVKCNWEHQIGELNLSDQKQINWHVVKKFKLTGNKITFFKSEFFTELKNVEKIDLYQNELSTIDFNEFESNLKLWDLNVGFNKITKIQQIAKSTNASITNLHIHNNDLSDISELCNLRKLKELNLSRNRRLDLSKVKFNCWSELTHLLLTETNLKSLNHDYRMLTGCKKLEYLNLMENDLRMLCLQRFPELPGLTFLNVRNNRLTNLDVQELKKQFKSLMKITTTGNEWSCDYQYDLTQLMEKLNMKETWNHGPPGEGNCLLSARNDKAGPVDICPTFVDQTTETSDKGTDTESNNTELAIVLRIQFLLLACGLCITILEILVLLRYYKCNYE
jgi:Leucine rich repeat